MGLFDVLFGGTYPMGDPQQNDPEGIRAWNLSQRQPSGATTYPYSSPAVPPGAALPPTGTPPPAASGGILSGGSPAAPPPSSGGGIMNTILSSALAGIGAAKRQPSLMRMSDRMVQGRVSAEQERLDAWRAQQKAIAEQGILGTFDPVARNAALNQFTGTYGSKAGTALENQIRARQKHTMDQEKHMKDLANAVRKEDRELSAMDRSIKKDVQSALTRDMTARREVERNVDNAQSIVDKYADFSKQMTGADDIAMMKFYARASSPEAINESDVDLMRRIESADSWFAQKVAEYKTGAQLSATSRKQLWETIQTIGTGNRRAILTTRDRAKVMYRGMGGTGNYNATAFLPYWNGGAKARAQAEYDAQQQQ